MLKKSCTECGKKVERKFNYCPYCGSSFKVSKEEEDYGFLGKEDETDFAQEMKNLPFGMNKLVNSLVKQLEKELSEIDKNGSFNYPKGIRINVSTGRPVTRQIVKEDQRKNNEVQTQRISAEEINRRINLPKMKAESKIKRLSDKVIYEINVPGVKEKEDITITKLATGIEVRAYSKEKCYIKFIPLMVELVKYLVKDEKVYLELKV